MSISLFMLLPIPSLVTLSHLRLMYWLIHLACTPYLPSSTLKLCNQTHSLARKMQGTTGMWSHLWYLVIGCILVDFSASGCGIYLTQQSDIDIGWKIKASLILSEYLDGELVYKVVSKKRQGQGWFLGIQFPEHIEMNDELRTLLLEQAFTAGSL